MSHLNMSLQNVQTFLTTLNGDLASIALYVPYPHCMGSTTLLCRASAILLIFININVLEKHVITLSLCRRIII